MRTGFKTPVDETPFGLVCRFLATMVCLQAAAVFAASAIPQGVRPLIRKLGTIDLDLVETTPIVFNERLYRFEWVREGYWNNQRKTNYFRFVEHENGEVQPPFADGHEFGSAFVHDQAVY